MGWLRRQPRGRHAPGNGVRTGVRPVDDAVAPASSEAGPVPDRGPRVGADPVLEADVALGFSDGTQVQLQRDDPRSHAFRLVAAALIGDREPQPADRASTRGAAGGSDPAHGSRPSLVRPIPSR